LMSEAISYIAAAQVPAVFVNIMRGGPGLGGILPAQGDYFQATKGGGHGDYRLLVLAPDGVQEAVEMTMNAFTLAEKYRGPVMILGDGLIGQMMEPVEFPDNLKTEPTNKDDWATNGMDTRKSDKRNLVKSLFLDPKALNDNNLALKAKYNQMRKEEVLYEGYNTDTDYEVLITSYGTMSRVCKTSIDMMKEEGINVGLLRPKTLFPFPKEAVFNAATKESCKAVISIEMSMGQMVEDVERSVKGQREVSFYGECGGEIPTPEKIIEVIKSLIS
jgi:2-oxoglutarate ferredoxin oxidoreductase subunit alpha